MISVVMAYYNRKTQLISTLRTIQESIVKEKEVIIVDDGSSARESVRGLPDFGFSIKTRSIPRHSLGMNPSPVYNLAFSMASGDVIVIQNPENLHYGDVLDYANKHTSRGTYLLFSCRNLPSTYIPSISAQSSLSQIVLKNILSDGENNDDFYLRYSKRRPELHWCSSISRSDLRELNGFDERFSKGYDFDDDEFYRRIVRKNMKINMLGEDLPFVLHQDHPRACGREYRKLHDVNKRLFIKTSNETSFRANGDRLVLL